VLILAWLNFINGFMSCWFLSENTSFKNNRLLILDRVKKLFNWVISCRKLFRSCYLNMLIRSLRLKIFKIGFNWLIFSNNVRYFLQISKALHNFQIDLRTANNLRTLSVCYDYFSKNLMHFALIWTYTKYTLSVIVT